MDEQSPASLTIPYPVLMSHKRGAFAKKIDDLPVSMRITNHDYAMIQRECAAIGMPTTTFIRWCAVQAARELASIRTGEKPRVDL